MSVGRSNLESRVEQLYSKSEAILDQCALGNGALVAANSDIQPPYPPSAENYRFSWARDGAYQLLAAYALDPDMAADRAIHYAQWLGNVHGFNETGLYVKRYGTNGAPDNRYGQEYQPDQAGTLISALDQIVPESHPVIDTAIKKMANGLTSQWNGISFGSTQDLWENRETDPTRSDIFTYSVAATRHGLSVAAVRFDQQADKTGWLDAIEGMSTRLDTAQLPTYLRKIYPDGDHDLDNTLDASLTGLIYPFSDSRTAQPSALAVATVHAINNQLYIPGQGVMRYVDDTYDGIVRKNQEEATAGTWPLLTFWLAIALSHIGENDTAYDIFMDTVERLDHEYKQGQLAENYIPEQLYPDKERQGKGVIPLAWSHAKFILAAKTLGIA